MAIPELTRARLLRQSNAREVEPLVETCLVVARNHVTVGDIVAEAIGGFLTGARWHTICLNLLQRCNVVPQL